MSGPHLRRRLSTRTARELARAREWTPAARPDRTLDERERTELDRLFRRLVEARHDARVAYYAQVRRRTAGLVDAVRRGDLDATAGRDRLVRWTAEPDPDVPVLMRRLPWTWWRRLLDDYDRRTRTMTRGRRAW